MTENKVIKMEHYDNTPFMELHKGIFQNGHIWRILDTKKPSTIRLYFTMVSMAIISPDIRNKHAANMFNKHTNKNNQIICWLPYSQIKHRCEIHSRHTIKKALDELRDKALIKDTEDDGIYSIGYISNRVEPKYRLHLHDVMDAGPIAAGAPVCTTTGAPVCTSSGAPTCTVERVSRKIMLERI